MTMEQCHYHNKAICLLLAPITTGSKDKDFITGIEGGFGLGSGTIDPGTNTVPAEEPVEERCVLGLFLVRRGCYISSRWRTQPNSGKVKSVEMG